MSDATKFNEIERMNDLHVELGRKAAEKAMAVLDHLGVDEIPVATAVSLLKFGVELERKALGQSEDEVDTDPFDALAKAMAAKPAGKSEEQSEEEES